MKKDRLKAENFRYDCTLLSIVVSLICIGFVMVTSASMAVAAKSFGSPFYFLFRQAFFFGIGVFLTIIVMRIPLKFWEKTGHILLLLSLTLLFLVLIKGIGREINGSMRWIGFGPVSLQVSELAKFSMIIYLAGYLIRHEEEVKRSFRGFLKPMLILALMGSLLLLEPDFGAFLVISLTVLGVVFLSGARLWQFILLIVAVAFLMVFIAISSPYRVVRLTTFLHPWQYAFGSGYQLTQSLIAFGRGGIFGVGLGNSVQKLFYLPEAHTDFLFAVLAEEFGLLGEFLVIALFVALVLRIFYLGKESATKKAGRFGSYLAYGFGLWLGLQAIINIGVNSGVLPTKGLTLPFLSYGGSSMLFYCMAIGILLRIYHENTN